MKKRITITRRVLRNERGVALLMVLITIAILTSVVVDFAYQTRINMNIAANVRDRVKAQYLARSAVNISRLVLYFQGQVDKFTGGMVKLYQIIPVESELAKALTSGEVGKAFGMEGIDLEGIKGFGELDGSFSAKIDDEYKKINVNALDSLPSIIAPTTANFLQEIGNPRFQVMFEEPDADGQYSTPADVATAVHDWIDEDTTQDSFNPELLLTDPFSQVSIFQPGTSSEDARYDMLNPPYENKNDPFLSLDELFMVRGVSDDFMNEFGDLLTVYTDPGLLLNLTSVDDPRMMLAILCMQPENQALCNEQGLPQLMEALAMFFEFRTMMQVSTFMVPNNQAIQGFFDSQSLAFSPYFMNKLAPFSDTFSIEATGESGEATVTIRTVVKNTTSGQETLYWRVQ